ncbi:DUF1571 domain-containing protein [Paludisphaera rhizosphaerae]|uniref:DUF1571 domain-containing protein n=1 Tax=Paludisphaera rhizosphaerae TaxID=2711216 RepID=UPI0013EE18F4|nr:DUF1571 domain-containing protein [Paludisphaera rhizosphaerae]
MNRDRSGGAAVAGSRRILVGSLGKRRTAAFLALSVALAAACPMGDDPKAKSDGDPKIALTDVASRSAPRGDAAASIAPESPCARAVRIIRECQTRFAEVKDYTCTFYKRERIGDKLTDMNVMSMKMRNQPQSVYFKFHQPNKGREAIYVEGKNDGYVLAHDVGFTKFLAGTMRLDPNGARAMENCRHPVTKAGIGNLIQTVVDRWGSELSELESVVLFDPKMRLGSSPCLLIEAIHPEKKPQFMFHKVRLFIDEALGLPIRYEAYDWPNKTGETPELLEEYAYEGVKLNVGLGEADFDAANKLYSFGRF